MTTHEALFYSRARTKSQLSSRLALRWRTKRPQIERFALECVCFGRGVARSRRFDAARVASASAQTNVVRLRAVWRRGRVGDSRRAGRRRRRRPVESVRQQRRRRRERCRAQRRRRRVVDRLGRAGSVRRRSVAATSDLRQRRQTPTTDAARDDRPRPATATRRTVDRLVALVAAIGRQRVASRARAPAQFGLARFDVNVDALGNRIGDDDDDDDDARCFDDGCQFFLSFSVSLATRPPSAALPSSPLVGVDGSFGATSLSAAVKECVRAELESEKQALNNADRDWNQDYQVRLTLCVCSSSSCSVSLNAPSARSRFWTT